MSGSLIFTCPFCRAVVDYTCLCDEPPPLGKYVGHATVEEAKAHVRQPTTAPYRRTAMTAEKIAEELRAGLAGVTPGPWVVLETTINGTSYGGYWLELADPDGMIQMSGSGGARSYTMRVIDQQDHDDNEVNMRHFANCSPDRITTLLDELDRLKARVAEMEAGGWQPIETAPKDGTIIHVWADGYLWPETVKWERYDLEDADEIGEDGYWTFAEELLQNVTDDCGADLWTHWQPLPAPRLPSPPHQRRHEWLRR